MDRCADLNLLVSELVNNAVVHGRGRIQLQLERRGTMIWAQVSDEGPGFDAALNAVKQPHTGGWGLHLLEALAPRWGLAEGSTRVLELRSTFTRLVRSLESRPLTTRVRPTAGGPRVKVVLDGGALVNWLVDMALFPPMYPKVPNWIDQLAAGRPRNIAASWASVSKQPTNGLQYGVECSEWLPFVPRSDLLQRGRRAFPLYPDSVLAQPPQIPFAFNDCRIWDVPKAPAAQRAVTQSSIPTLLLSGRFDAVTPPSQARIAARTLANSTVVAIPGVGHDTVDKSPCAQRVFASFLSAPSAPNTGCVARLSPPTLR